MSDVRCQAVSLLFFAIAISSKHVIYNLGNFQAFVQPALGILMLGTVAGNFIKEEDEDEREWT